MYRTFCATLIAFALSHAAASAQPDCPSAKTTPGGYTLERNQSTSQITFLEKELVQTILRVDGKTWLETVEFAGLFDLERIDRGKRWTFGTKTDLAKLLPLKVGQEITVRFEVTPSQPTPIVNHRLTVKRTDALYIGACKYQVLVFERHRSSGDNPPQSYAIEYYAPALKLVIAREWPGTGSLNKFDRIYSVGR